MRELSFALRWLVLHTFHNIVLGTVFVLLKAILSLRRSLILPIHTTNLDMNTPRLCSGKWKQQTWWWQQHLESINAIPVASILNHCGIYNIFLSLLIIRRCKRKWKYACVVFYPSSWETELQQNPCVLLVFVYLISPVILHGEGIFCYTIMHKCVVLRIG